MKPMLQQLARYNQWANGRLYKAAFDLPEDIYRRDVGAFFKSLHGTLNHLLVVDRMWLKRLTGEGEHPDRLDAIIHEDKRLLALDRAEQDDRIIKTVDEISPAALGDTIEYANLSGKSFEQRRCDVLMHVFNHHTTIGGKPIASCPFVPEPNRLRWICSLCKEAGRQSICDHLHMKTPRNERAEILNASPEKGPQV